MTLGRALGHLDDESDYTVDVHDRLRELLLPGDEDLGADVELTYSWSGGYERLTYHRAGGGSSEYRGSFHPNVVCETGTDRDTGVCIRCGRTLM